MFLQDVISNLVPPTNVYVCASFSSFTHTHTDTHTKHTKHTLHGVWFCHAERRAKFEESAGNK